MGYRINVKNCKYAKVTTNNSTTYAIDTPVALPGLMSLDITMLSSSGELYGDGALVSKVAKITGATIKIGLDKISTAAKAALTGATISSDGVLSVKTSDTIPVVAIYAETEQDDGKKEQMWFLCGQAEPISLNATQATGSINYSTEELTINCIRREKDNTVYQLIDTSDSTVQSSTSTSFESTPIV